MQPTLIALKQLFDIKFEKEDSAQKVLSLRLGAKHCCFAISNKAASEIYQLAYLTIDEWNEDDWKKIFEVYPDLDGLFYEVMIAFDFSESTLVPLMADHSADNGLILKSLFGINSMSSVITESVTGWQLNNVYALPPELKLWIQNKFPAARYWHQYSLGVRNSNSSEAIGTLLVDFRKEDFVVIATASNNILLTQTFEYSTPADVLYYLIKICDQFVLSRELVKLQISGLVDQQSSLYKELYQYFCNIEFREATWNAGDDYPAHFFTTLNDLAKCVS